MINPGLLLAKMERDFARYIAQLKNPRNKRIRDPFEKVWPW